MKDEPELLFLHELPLDGALWAAQRGLLPGASHEPTLYRFGGDMEAWTCGALDRRCRLIVVVGSCALDVAAIAPPCVAALALIGTKAAIGPTRR